MGQNVRFILTILASGYATNDRAVWGTPRILRIAPATSLPTYTPSPTPTPSPIPTPPVQWSIYTNTRYHFTFWYPQQAQITESTENFLHMRLPFTPGTTLTDKYLEVSVTENAETCQSPLATRSILYGSENIVLNGLPFLKQFGMEGAAGHVYKWTAYSTRQGNICISLDFVLKVVDPGVFLTPPPPYDEVLESAIFEQMASTFAWLAVTPVPSETPTAVPSETPTLQASETPSAPSTP